MRLLIQRVEWAAVEVENQEVGRIGRGLLVLVGFRQGDTEATLARAAHKLLNLRLFEDEAGRLNRSLREVGGELLIVSQFTLYGRLEKGFRPSFTEAAPAAEAQKHYERFLALLRQTAPDIPIATGIFGAFMRLHLLNYGPVTLLLEF
ncbi:MAG: D-aminoacyl-tRNA deacylase [Bacteroidia bacterium]